MKQTPTGPDTPDAGGPSASELSQALSRRYGPAIARAAMASAGLQGLADHAVTHALAARVVEVAEEAELAMAGALFMDRLAVSAVAGSKLFQTTAAGVGLQTEALSWLTRLEIDTAFANAWPAQGNGAPASGSREEACGLLRQILLKLPRGGGTTMN